MMCRAADGHRRHLRPHDAARHLHSAHNGLCYGIAQGINLLVQILLLHQLGKTTFGTIGLAQMCVTALIFIGELGMPSYFIREASIRSNWRHQWQRACLVRAGVIGLGTLGLLLFWKTHYSMQMPGFDYLLWAIPGMAVSVLNPTPLLIAQGHAKTAAGGLLVLWIVYAIAAIVAMLFPPALVDGGLGAAFSLGYIAFTLCLWRRVHWHAATDDPAAHAHRDMLMRAITVWVPGLLGTLYALLLTFSIQHLLPAILAYVVLGTQLLQGISGLNTQLQRVLLSALSGEYRHRPGEPSRLAADLFTLAGRVAIGLILGLFAVLCLIGYFTGDALIPANARYFTFMLAERLIGLMSAFLVTSLFAQHREYFVFRVMVATYLLSMAAQFALTYGGYDLQYVLAIRILTCLLQMGCFYRVLRCRFSPASIIGAFGILLIGLIPYTTDSLGIVGLLAACIGGGLCLLTLRDYYGLHRRTI